ncbi:MAG: peptidoglycan editing factor PgeF [Alphaproteobacteria bacterium]|jgi:polyphenol oxidase|nr:peptidoglycan editing factor PgeF [Alphaproteobacteria bacterium]
MNTPHVTADSLTAASGIRHAFLSRDGGVSHGIYAGLNCGLGSDDNPDHVRENRARAAQTIGVATDRLRTLYQVHSATVIDADAPWVDEPPRADALVCTTPGVAIGVLAADCAPVLFADPEARIVGAAHAGWRGALDGVVGATIDAMLERGAKAEQITATVGPCIGPKSYEVGPEFPAGFLQQDHDNERFFTRKPNSDRLLFDLPAFVHSRLIQSGVINSNITGHDTYSDDRFFSYRRSCHHDEPDYGRNLSLITLLNDS